MSTGHTDAREPHKMATTKAADAPVEDLTPPEAEEGKAEQKLANISATF